MVNEDVEMDSVSAVISCSERAEAAAERREAIVCEEFDGERENGSWGLEVVFEG